MGRLPSHFEVEPNGVRRSPIAKRVAQVATDLAVTPARAHASHGSKETVEVGQLVVLDTSQPRVLGTEGT